TLTVEGANFVPGATVFWNGLARATTFVNSTYVTAAIPAEFIRTPGTASITVRNPDGIPSTPLTFTISSGGCPTGQFFAEYFANIALSGTPARTACESTINN